MIEKVQIIFMVQLNSICLLSRVSDDNVKVKKFVDLLGETY